jgi:hypothetical protein
LGSSSSLLCLRLLRGFLGTNNTGDALGSRRLLCGYACLSFGCFLDSLRGTGGFQRFGSAGGMLLGNLSGLGRDASSSTGSIRQIP